MVDVSLVVTAVPRTVSFAKSGVATEGVVWARVGPQATWEPSLEKARSSPDNGPLDLVLRIPLVNGIPGVEVRCRT